MQWVIVGQTLSCDALYDIIGPVSSLEEAQNLVYKYNKQSDTYDEDVYYRAIELTSVEEREKQT